MTGTGQTLPHDTLHRILAVSRQLSATPDLPRILSVIIDAMRDLLGAERATVFEHDADAGELFTTVAHGVSATGAGAGEIRFPLDAGLAGESARTRAIINVPDAAADDRFNPEIDRKTGFHTRSLLTIPLEDHAGELVGVAQVLNKRGGPFTRDDEEVATALAAQAAVALRRGRLIEDRLVREKLEHDLELARRIQQRTFPTSLPVLAGFDVEAWSEPADETGGDAFDVVAFPSGGSSAQAVLLLADATGHGVGPALSATQVRAMLRMAVRLGAQLAEIAAHVNRQLCEDLPDGRFVTTWLGVLDAAAGTLTSFSAGQAPLLHYHAADDRFDELDADAVPLGIDEDLDVAIEPPRPLAPGDVFAAISDGIFETRDPAGTLFGTGRVMETIRAGRAGTSAGILRALRDAVDRFADGRPADDDRTVILIKRGS